MKTKYQLNAYEAKFMNKVNKFHGHTNFDWLLGKAEKAIRMHTGFGFHAIASKVFIDQVIESTHDEIADLLNTQLEEVKL